MQIEKHKQKDSFAIKFEAKADDKVIGRAYLYVLKNNLHEEPFGFMEDIFVDEAARGQGLGTRLVEAVIAEAKEQGCYKLIGNSRHSRKKVHEFYKKFGFEDWGTEFRLNLLDSKPKQED